MIPKDLINKVKIDAVGRDSMVYGDLEEKVEELEERIEKLEERIEKLEERIEKLEERIEELTGEVRKNDIAEKCNLGHFKM